MVICLITLLFILISINQKKWYDKKQDIMIESLFDIITEYNKNMNILNVEIQGLKQEKHKLAKGEQVDYCLSMN